MAVEMFTVAVAYATPAKQFVLELQVPTESTAVDAINTSGILQHCPEIDLTQQTIGLFGQLCSLEHKLTAGDRVEIYRPLQQAPMTARRNRIVK